MICTFFGHRDVTVCVKARIRDVVLDLIRTGRVSKFLVGNNGNFDFYVQCVLEELKNDGVGVTFDIVLSRVNEKALSENQRETVFPEELEKSIPKFAISKRNDWLIKNSSILIAYVEHRFSNSSKLLEKAIKRGLEVINLAD